MRPRHSRQTRLAEVGEAGQRRIEAAPARVRGDGVAAEVEARYLAGAGVRVITVSGPRAAAGVSAVDATTEVRQASGADTDSGADPDWIEELVPAAREVARGAHRALVALRRAVVSGDAR